jgi:hypothetical protein
MKVSFTSPIFFLLCTTTLGEFWPSQRWPSIWGDLGQVFTSPILEINAQTFNMLHRPSAGLFFNVQQLLLQCSFSTEPTFIQNMRHDNRYTATHSGINYPWNMSIYDMCIWYEALQWRWPSSLPHPTIQSLVCGSTFLNVQTTASRWLQTPLPIEWLDDWFPHKTAPF